MGIYDGIFIDMSSEMNKNNFTVLSACDEIILLCQQDKKSKVKLECMLKQLQLMTTRCGFDITDKFSLVINKYAPNGNAEVEEISVCGKEVIIKIPVIAGLTNIQGEIYKLDMNSDFAKQIHQLLMKY
jgi:cellulose biosynthesis protein BcsQ